MLPCYKRVALIALFVLVSSGCGRSGFWEAGDSGVGTCTDDPVMDGSRCKLPDGSLGICITARGGCVESFCGDGFTDFLGGEACDDGDTNDCTGSCNAECSGPANSCGDGTVRCGESCDDGETSDCSGVCNADCTGPANICGDGIWRCGEACDDGDTSDCTGNCNAECTGPANICGDEIWRCGEACDDGDTSDCTGSCNAECNGPANSCGDGTVRCGESCDDGDTSDCSGVCNADCTGPANICGDGIWRCGEACDDGDTSDCTGSCDAKCNGPANSCGDGTVRCGESCDDGETSDCSGSCNAECNGPANSCGDGMMRCGESCDDGETSDCSGVCNADCTGPANICGDGIWRCGEACDDGDTSDCTGSCNAECSGPANSCGDGTVRCGESCDDGETSDCSGTCNANCSGPVNSCTDGRICVSGTCVCPGGTIETTCDDSIDNDCDSFVDCADTDCDGKTCGANGLRCIGNSCECPGGTVESVCGDGLDNDCDGNVDCDDSDCNAWPHDREIAIDNQAGTIVLTNYEVEVELISANFVFSEALADGADVRFTDDTQTIQLDYWIKQWDPAAEHALIGVEVPLIPAGGTTSIHMRHGNTCATTESNGNNVYPYFDHWTTNNTGDWIEQLVFENTQVLWENTRSFDMSRELVMEGQLLNWWSGPFDHTELGWTIDKSSSIHNVESVYVQWHQHTGQGATSAIIPIRLSARVGATLTYTPFVFVDRPESTDILRLSLIFTPNFLSYEWRNLTTDTLLASDSIADAGLIPDISSVQYLFNSNLSCCGIGGNFWSWSSPTCLTWGNNSFNGGMEWQTDYWYIRQYSNPEPIVTVTP